MSENSLLSLNTQVFYISKVKVADTPFHIQGEDFHPFKSKVTISMLYLIKTQNILITIDYLPFSLDFFQYATCCIECKVAKNKFLLLNQNLK